MTRRIASTKGAKKRADTLFSLIVRLRDGACRYCGKDTDLQCAHLVSRRFSALRTDERNAVALCAAHHMYFTDRPVAFGVWVISWMGEAEYVALQARAQRVTKVDWNAEAARLAVRYQEIQQEDK